MLKGNMCRVATGHKHSRKLGKVTQAEKLYMVGNIINIHLFYTKSV